jgi:sugar lactone lactonase YvrE
MYKVLSKKKCILGEGLYIHNSHIYWVDILKHKIFSTEKKFNFKIDEYPSVILLKKKGLIIGTNTGIYNYFNGKKKTLIVSFRNYFDSKIYRSNDGCHITNDKFLIGIMPMKNLKKNGKLLFIENKKIYDLKFKIKIPNTFIKLAKNKFLVSDSYLKIIYEITLCFKKKKIVKKKIFYKFKKDIPDGGCLLPQKKIAITIWNSKKIIVLDRRKNLIKEIKLPFSNPTNCKFSVKSNRLFVTSAAQNLNRLIDKNSLSGHTICIEKINEIFNNY